MPSTDPDYMRRWRAAHPDYMRRWRAAHPDRVRRYDREWRRRNAERLRAQDRERKAQTVRLTGCRLPRWYFGRFAVDGIGDLTMHQHRWTMRRWGGSDWREDERQDKALADLEAAERRER